MRKEGKCPNCDTEGQLIYNELETSLLLNDLEKGQAFRRFRCDVCGMYGKEYYMLTYTDSILVV